MAFLEQPPKWEEPGIEPPESKKVTGWQAEDRPPAGWLNWFFNRSWKAIKELQEKSVEKISGKGLSANDYTTAEKNKLSGVATNANNYSHPSTHPATIITEDATHRFATDAEKAAWNAKAPTDSPEFTGALTEGGYHTSKLIGAVSPSSGVANQKIDLFFGNGNNHASTFHGRLEITVAGVMNGGVASGAVTRTYGVVLQPNGVLSDQDTRYSEVTGRIDEHIAISPITWDAINSRWKIQIIIRSSVVNTYSVYMAAQSGALSHIDNISTLALGSFYTTDTTAWPAPVVTFNKYVMGVTKPTDDVSNVLATTALVQAKIDAQLAEAPPVPITLSPGLQRIDSDRQARLAHVGFNGRTLVNIPGRDGGCESLAPFINSSTGNREISTTIKRSGVNSIKFSSTATQSYLYKDYSYPLDKTKYHIAGCWVYIESTDVTTGNFEISIREVGAFTVRGLGAFADKSKVGAWQFLVVRIPPANLLEGNGFRLLFGQTGNITAVSYWDEIRIYEVTATDYNAIPGMMPEQVAARWPYTEGIANVDNVYLKRYGRNLLKGVPDILHPQATLNSPYDLTLTPTSNYRGSGIGRFAALPNAQYTFSFKASLNTAGNYAYADIYWVDLVGKRTYLSELGLNVVGTAIELKRTFTTPAGCVALDVALSNASLTGTPTMRFQNWQLELGSVATPFVPNDDQSLYVYNAQASGSVDGSVVDQVYTDTDGRLRVRRLWGRAELSGSLGWSVYDKNPTNKILACAGFGSPTALSSRRFIKNDGKVLTPVTSSAGAGADSFSISTANTVLTVDNGDAGWGFDFNPSIAEAQAYFFGYRMNNGTFGTPYNNTGTKTWTRWDATSNVGAVTTVPTTQAAGYTPYQLQYQLAAPVDEPVTQEGAITLLAGSNQVEMGIGVILREQIVPYLSGSLYYINGSASSTPRYRPAAILSIYKNGLEDRKWTKRVRSTTDVVAPIYGLGFADIPASDRDSSAVYTVTYMALDTYLTGIAPLAITGDRAANTRGNMDDVIETQADMQAQLDTLDSGVQAAFQHGNERKQEVVALLIAKGITATTTESWDSLISEMTAIVKATGNATPADVLVGKEFSTATGNAKLGTMPNNGTKVYTPTSGNVPIDAGYHVGSVVAAVAVPADKVLAGTTIAGTPGTMPNNSNSLTESTGHWPSGTGDLHVFIPKGAYLNPAGSGYPETAVHDPDFIPANFRGDKNVFGLQGGIPIKNGSNGNGAMAHNHHVASEVSPSNGHLFVRPNGAGGAGNALYEGDCWLDAVDPNFIPSNIRDGTTMFGRLGTLIEGRRWASGGLPTPEGVWENDAYYYTLQIGGLAFRPRVVIITGSDWTSSAVCMGFWTDDSSVATRINGGVLIIDSFPQGNYPATWTPHASGITIKGTRFSFSSLSFVAFG